MTHLPDMFEPFVRLGNGCPPPEGAIHPNPIPTLAKGILYPIEEEEAPLPPENREGAIWGKIRTLEKEAGEQLFALYCAASRNDASPPENRTLPLLDFAYNLFSKREGKKRLGELLYLTDHQFHDVCQHVLNRPEKEAADWITEAFAAELKKERAAFSRNIKAHRRFRLQEPSLVQQTKLPLMISSFLLTSSGQFNLYLIELFEKLLVEEEAQNSYIKSLIEGLRRLGASRKIRKQILQTKLPSKPHSLMNALLRIQFDLPKSAVPTELEAKRCLLANLLSHLRQSPSGSCFATFLAIFMQRCYPLQCLSDLCFLMEKGMLTRSVNGIVKDFPAHLRIRSKEIDRKICLDRKGRLYDNKEPIAEAPGIAAAFRAMGIEAPQKTLASILKGGKNRFTVRELLRKLAYATDSKEPYKLFALGCFAFQSETNPALLRVWENSIAQMAEAHEAGMVKLPILYTVITALKEKGLSPAEIDRLREELLKRIHLYYDPDIVKKSEEEAYETVGGFVLYDMNLSRTPSEWLRVDSPEKFSAFVQRTLEGAGLSEPLAYVKSAAFIVRAVRLYSQKNREISDPMHNWKRLPHTPWRTLSGNIARHVMDVYLQADNPVPPCSLTAINGKALMEILNDLAKLYPDRIIPVFTPYHAFTMALDAHFEERCRHCRSRAEEIASASVPKKVRTHLLETVGSAMIRPSMQKTFLRRMKMIPECSNYRQLRKQTLRIVEAIEGPDEGQRTRIDRLIFENFPEEVRDRILDSSVIFADTGWQKELFNIYYCLALNPLTGSWSLLEVSEDGKLLLPVKKSRFFNQEWKYYPKLDIPA